MVETSTDPEQTRLNKPSLAVGYARLAVLRDLIYFRRIPNIVVMIPVRKEKVIRPKRKRAVC